MAKGKDRQKDLRAPLSFPATPQGAGQLLTGWPSRPLPNPRRAPSKAARGGGKAPAPKGCIPGEEVTPGRGRWGAARKREDRAILPLRLRSSVLIYGSSRTPALTALQSALAS